MIGVLVSFYFKFIGCTFGVKTQSYDLVCLVVANFGAAVGYPAAHFLGIAQVNESAFTVVLDTSCLMRFLGFAILVVLIEAHRIGLVKAGSAQGRMEFVKGLRAYQVLSCRQLSTQPLGEERCRKESC